MTTGHVWSAPLQDGIQRCCVMDCPARRRSVVAEYKGRRIEVTGWQPRPRARWLDTRERPEPECIILRQLREEST